MKNNIIKKALTIYSIFWFWLWNLTYFILLIFIEVETGVLYEIIKNGFVGFTPMNFSIYTITLILIPFFSLFSAIKLFKFNRHKIIKYFYGIEIPLMILLILRISIFRELTDSTFHIFTIVFFGMLSFFIHLVIDKKKKSSWYRYTQLIGNSLLLMVGIYFGLVLFQYAIPLVYIILKEFFSFNWVEELGRSFILFLSLLFTFLTFIVLITQPFAMIYFYTNSFLKTFKSALRNNKILMFLIVGINIFLVFIFNNFQSQTYSFIALDKDFSKKEHRVNIVENSRKIKKGLINAYLNSYRYLGSKKDNNHIEELYNEAFGENKISKEIQVFNNILLSPFLYDGNMRDDQQKAKDLYEKYFDSKIQKTETKQILKSMKSTWNRDGVEAGVLNINQKKVHIEKQEITIKENEDIAEIEIHEVYSNQTFSMQEIFYYFSLPQNAVITGLWLSDNDSMYKKYKYTISPRGAAQKVYKEEVRRRVDPSLLEQVGPNQYRLRAFPILPKTKKYNDEIREFRNKFEVKDGDNFHLWLAYKTIISSNSEWEFPKLLEKRNVYWTKNTDCIINGIKTPKNKRWFPLAIKSKNKVERKTHMSKVSNLNNIIVEPKLLSSKYDFTHKKVSVIIDGSMSMVNEKSNINKAINTINNLGFESVQTHLINELDLEIQNELKVEKSAFFGNITLLEILHKFILLNNQKHDVVILLTDRGNYEMSSDSIMPVAISSPLFVWHIGAEQSPIYNDNLLETLQNSKGKIINNRNELISEFNLLNAHKSILNFKDGLLYSKISGSNINHKEDLNFKNIAAKLLIENTPIKSDSSRVHQLDEIHKMAIKNSIVTMYSSMIVLVNDTQREALLNAEKAADRFDREVESGDEDPTASNGILNVSGTPEPHEWILLFVVMILLLYRYYSKKLKIIGQ